MLLNSKEQKKKDRLFSIKMWAIIAIYFFIYYEISAWYIDAQIDAGRKNIDVVGSSMAAAFVTAIIGFIHYGIINFFQIRKERKKEKSK